MRIHIYLLPEGKDIPEAIITSRNLCTAILCGGKNPRAFPKYDSPVKKRKRRGVLKKKNFRIRLTIRNQTLALHSVVDFGSSRNDMYGHEFVSVGHIKLTNYKQKIKFLMVVFSEKIDCNLAPLKIL